MSVISSNGVVDGICEGTGIQPNATDYETRSTSYYLSQPALGSVLYAAVEMELYQSGLAD